MNPWLILAALIAVVAVVFISRAVRPGTGGRRATEPALLEVLDKFEAHCVAEDRPTVHYRTRVHAEVFCMECRNPSPGLPGTITSSTGDRT